MPSLNIANLWILVLLTGYSCNTPSQETQNSAPNPRPNVVLIITDDQGYGDLGYHGNPFVKTPTLDSLAQVSTRLTNFYVSPVCAPTRSSLMTGRYSLRTGVYDTYNGGAMMASSETTLAEILKDQGYTTGMFGKWHLGDAYPSRPQDQGFVKSMIHPSGGMGQVGDVKNFFEFDSSYFNPTVWEDGEPVSKQGYCSDVFTNGALDFVQQNRDNPFFLYLSYNAPHTPLQLPSTYFDEYKDSPVDSIAGLTQGWEYPMNEKDIDDARRIYGMVSNIDNNLGRLFGRLNDLGIRENTLVIFITDNGPQQRRFNSGLRGLKGSVYEGGTRVPCFISFPGVLAEDQEIQGTFAHIDILPTVLSLVGVTPPGKNKLDGRNFAPALAGESLDWTDRPLFTYWTRGYPQPYRNIAVRKGDFKLVGQAAHDAEASDFELFNITADPFEQNNLSAAQPETVEQLKAEFDSWHAEIINNSNLVGFPRIHLGTEFENPVILNRNDTKVAGGIWAEEDKYGYWDVTVASAGDYRLSFYFKTELPDEGNLSVRIGTTQRTVEHSDTTTNLIQMDGIRLSPGDYRFESWYRENTNRQLRYPFYVEVEKI